MELWDIYDRDRNKKEMTMVRGDKIADGDFHLVVHICIFNSMGEMLIQQRQPFKEGWPDMWDITVGGSAIAGDSSQSAAERELFEEIGLNISLHNARPRLTVNFDRGFDDIYLVESDVDIDTLTLQYEEVQKVKWASANTIHSMIKSGIFIPYHESLINLLFDMRKGYGQLR